MDENYCYQLLAFGDSKLEPKIVETIRLWPRAIIVEMPYNEKALLSVSAFADERTNSDVMVNVLTPLVYVRAFGTELILLICQQQK